MKKILISCVFLVCTLSGEAQTTNLPSGITISFTWTNSIPVGYSLSWQLCLTSAALSSRTCRVTMDANAFGYNGSFLGDVATVFATNTLSPGATAIVSVTVSPTNYTAWTSKTRTFELSAYVVIQEDDEHWIGIGRTILTTTPNIVSVSPTPPIQQGHSVTSTVSFLNPLPVSLHNVKVTTTADEGLSTNAAITESSWDVGIVASNAWVTVSTNYVAAQIGTHNISALITADELKEVDGYTEVEVAAP